MKSSTETLQRILRIGEKLYKKLADDYGFDDSMDIINLTSKFYAEVFWKTKKV